VGVVDVLAKGRDVPVRESAWVDGTILDRRSRRRGLLGRHGWARHDVLEGLVTVTVDWRRDGLQLKHAKHDAGAARCGAARTGFVYAL
jgi:hypothetical protein